MLLPRVKLFIVDSKKAEIMTMMLIDLEFYEV